MTTLSTTFRRILDFRVRMALPKMLVVNLKLLGMLPTYFVGVSEPCGPLLFAAHQGNPLVTASAQTLPNVGVTIHASSFLRLLKWASSCGTDTMSETFIVPESAVLQD